MAHYVSNDPVNYIDPTGHFLESVWDAASLAMGVVECAAAPGVLSCGSVLVDAAALVLPGIPGGAGAAVKATRAGVKVAKSAKKLDRALDTFKTVRLQAGSEVFQLDKSGMRHILSRHHPDFWDGSVKAGQTFLRKNMSVDDVVNIVKEGAKQNRDKLLRLGTTRTFQVEAVVDDVKYVIGFRRGRVGQLYPQ